MSGSFISSRKKYSARGLAAGAVFCPACRKLTDRDTQQCPACGFSGEQTMSLFPVLPPPLEVISDFANLFGAKDRARVRKAINEMRRRFPQIHWKVVTASLREHEDIGLFAFWLLNVSPLAKEEEPGSRAWTVLLVVLAEGDVAVVPGYSAEVWLSGQQWGQLLSVFLGVARKKGYGIAVRDFLKEAGKTLDKSWMKARTRVKKNRYRNLIPFTRFA